MFAGLLTSKLIYLDAIGSDPTKPRKIPGICRVYTPPTRTASSYFRVC
jgi:hypothetical protein